jgi:allantoate deiminase
MTSLADKVIRCCRDLALFTEEPGRTTRTFLSPPMHDVHRHLTVWMRELNMQVKIDAAGNLRGVRTGTTRRRLIIASHLDTVPNAGVFDGILGVVMGIALIEALGSEAPAITIEVIGFSEEEGVRFGQPFIGSRALVGLLDDPDPRILDALRTFGLDPAELPAAKLSSDTIGYLEFHIEQGPVLESLNLPLGIVDAIAGQSRYNVTFHGKANHAGTTPMNLRRDALTAAARWILGVEKTANDTPGLVATTGALTVEPNATNIIPGTVRASLDIRHACDETRRSAVAHLLTGLPHEQRLDQPAIAIDPNLRATLTQAVEAAGYPVHHMTSGAGHDAMILAPHVPIAMLFLRSPGGISHHPDETVLPSDVAAALEVGLRFIHNV